MKVRDFLNEMEITKGETLPTDKKEKLRNKLKGIFDVIERYEKNGDIHRDDKEKVETFKDFLSDFTKDSDKDDGRV